MKLSTTSQDLNSAALSYTVTPNTDIKLQQVLVTFGASVSETVTLTFDSENGSNYDTVLVSEALSSATDYVFRPEGGLWFKKGDKILVTCTNATATTTVYVTIQWLDEGV